MQTVNGHEQPITPGSYLMCWGDPNDPFIPPGTRVDVLATVSDSVVLILDMVDGKVHRSIVWAVDDSERLTDAVRVMRDDDQEDASQPFLEVQDGQSRVCFDKL